jgi:hypothetical protein
LGAGFTQSCGQFGQLGGEGIVHLDLEQEKLFGLFGVYQLDAHILDFPTI